MVSKALVVAREPWGAGSVLVDPGAPGDEMTAGPGGC